MELRSQKAARNYLLNPPLIRTNPSSSHSSDPKLNIDDDDPLGASSSFVRANIRSLLITFSRRDCQKLSKLNLDFGNFLLEDTLQGCATDFPLLKISDDDDDGHQQQWETVRFVMVLLRRLYFILSFLRVYFAITNLYQIIFISNKFLAQELVAIVSGFEC